MASAYQTTQFHAFPAGHPADEVHQAVLADGAVILRGLFASQVDSLNADLDPVLQSTSPGVTGSERMQNFAGRKTKRITQIVRRSRIFRESMLDDATLLSYIDRMMLETAQSYWLSTAHVAEVQPDERAQRLHRDVGNFPVFRAQGPAAPEVFCNCIVALSDFTEAMGATRAIVGSHLWPDFSVPGTLAQSIAVEMEKGDAFLFSGKLIHGAGENRTDRPRRALALAYAPGWLMPEEAHPFLVPLGLARTLRPRAQQLLGFRSFHNESRDGGSAWQVDFQELADFLDLEMPSDSDQIEIRDA